MSGGTDTAPPRLGAVARWGFVAFMLALTGLFIVLGLWQVDRLGQKEALITAVESRADLPAEPLPAPNRWATLDPETYDFRPTTVTGRLVPDASVQVFTSLSDPRGPYGGAGYWIMTPMVLAGGEGLVWINRGFVPQDLVAEFADGQGAPQGEVTLAGLARRPEASNAFTPALSRDVGQDWVRDPARLSAFLGPELAGLPVAPVTLDQFSGAADALPQGGETVMTFSNRHLEYAGTWFAFALITPLMLGFWYWRQRKG